jgi:hypothetical protein
MVLPQPPNLEIIRNVGNIEDLEEDTLENDEHDQSDGNDPMEVRRSTRTLMPSTRLRDYITYSVTYPIENFIFYENISSQHEIYLASILKEQEP